MGGTEKWGGEAKILKRAGGKLCQGVGALKKGCWNPPYELCLAFVGNTSSDCARTKNLIRWMFYKID